MKNILIILVLALSGVAVWYFVIHNKNTATTGTTAGNNTVDSPPNGGDAGNLSTSDNTPVSTVYQNASNNGVQVITDLPTAGLGAGSSQYFSGTTTDATSSAPKYSVGQAMFNSSSNQSFVIVGIGNGAYSMQRVDGTVLDISTVIVDSQSEWSVL
jgi:uncharacterized iron-regulated membrane protein